MVKKSVCVSLDTTQIDYCKKHKLKPSQILQRAIELLILNEKVQP
jgi:hypothetical protein